MKGINDGTHGSIGTNSKNLPVTPDQIKQGLGGDFLSQLAGKAGGINQLLKMFQGKMGA